MRSSTGCVEVYQDDLGSEAMMTRCIASGLAIAQEAMEYSPSNLNKDAANLLWLLKLRLDEHAAELEAAAMGRRTGPRAPEEVAGV